MFDAIFWGAVQGLTEFLPISSSGHLVLIPALLGREGPDLTTVAMLHLGTLVAVLAYYRSDLARMARFDRPARRMITIIVIGTIPAVVFGLAFESKLDELTERPTVVAVMLIVTGVTLMATTLLRRGRRTAEELSPTDAGIIGLAQSLALIPGISRSGMTISAGLARGMDRVEAARFAFLLGIPVIAGAGLLSVAKAVSDGSGITVSTIVGMVVAAVVGYWAITFLIRVLGKVGLAPFGIYCVIVGAVAVIIL
ncbi:MAG: undecaprenyl-diphosphate phosphatase [Actinomycetota bacterium]|nr:undecaprenyl-diphosphate phosphatase [Actinomycetota bacterium]